MGHHYVPQRYLKNFEAVGHPGCIWMHDKKDAIARCIPIKNTAQAPGYYSNDDESRLANEVEGPANDLISRLIKGDRINLLERVSVTDYVGTMMRRVPQRRRKAMEMAHQVMDDVFGAIRSDFEAFATGTEFDPELIMTKVDELNKIDEEYKVSPPEEIIEKVINPWPSELICSTLFDMHWRILRAKGLQQFITTDNPVFFSECNGIGSEDSELFMPLSSSHVLHGHWKSSKCGLSFEDASERIVRRINSIMATQVERLAFYHKKAPWLITLLNRPADRLN